MLERNDTSRGLDAVVGMCDGGGRDVARLGWCTLLAPTEVPGAWDCGGDRLLVPSAELLGVVCPVG